jgi:hypothetical protein
MSLPPRSVDALFARLLVRYGAQWLRMWEHVEPEDVKADWEQVLKGMPGYKLLHGLEHLRPERPPTATQFRALCLGLPTRRELYRLPRPSANPVRVAEMCARAKARVAEGASDPLRTARQLRDRERNGERLSFAQREHWRARLRHETTTEEQPA